MTYANDPRPADDRRRYDNDPVVADDRRPHDDTVVTERPVTPAEIPHGDALVEEKRRFGGVKFGSAFFGWLTAVGAVVLLTAVVGAIGAAVGVETGTSPEEAANAASDNPQTVGIVGAIAVAVALFVAYLAGGYVAGRMARFSGAMQGLAVWLWGLIIAIVVALLTMLAGSRWNLMAAVDALPRIPMDATTTGIISAIVAAVVTLAGAILGGMLGMRFHRKVDRLGADDLRSPA
ncbi:YrzE family protein [Microbacterium sp. HJ5]